MRKEAAAEQNILTLLETLRNLMKNLGLTAEQAMTAWEYQTLREVFLLKEFSKSSTGRSKLKIERWSAFEIKKWYDPFQLYQAADGRCVLHSMRSISGWIWS